MHLEQAISIAENYLNSPSEPHDVLSPLLIDCPNADVLSDLSTYFMLPESRRLHAPSCAHDSHPDIADICESLQKRTQATILDEYTLFLKLKGKDEAKCDLSMLLHKRFKFPLVIFCTHCSEVIQILKAQDIRLQEQIIHIDGNKGKLPILTFIKPQNNADYAQKLVEREDFAANIRDISSLAKYIEHPLATQPSDEAGFVETPKILVETTWTSEMFPYSDIKIDMIDSPFSLLKHIDRIFIQFDTKDGTDAQWSWLLETVSQVNRFERAVQELLGLPCDALDRLDKYAQWSPNQQWLYILALRHRSTNHPYLKEVIQNTSAADQFIRQLYRTIAAHAFSEQGYWALYEARKELLKQLNDDSGEAENFCSWIAHKENTAIYYLTDLTRAENELTLRLIAKYANEDNFKNYLKTLQTVCPELATYLQGYTLPISNLILSNPAESRALSRYFDDYRTQKVLNRLSEQFLANVNTQAQTRVFYRFPQRSNYIHKICSTAQTIPTQIWFADALGIEFIPYIARLCKDMDLICNIDICRANLPTITKYNTEFIPEFENAGIKVNNIKDIDDLKHHPIQDADLQKADIALHLIDELDAIKRILRHIKQKLQTFETKRAILLSDHGASRLAVLAGAPVYEVEAIAEESGRVCATCTQAANLPIAVHSDATNAQDCYVLADYGRFHGTNICRKATVEVHGGATLEEVLIPLCEISLPHASENIEITLTTPEVSVSPRQCAVIKLFSTVPTSALSIKFTDKRYNGRILDGETQDGKMFTFTCDFIKVAGKYTFDVYMNNACIKPGVSFATVNMGMTENDDMFF